MPQCAGRVTPRCFPPLRTEKRAVVYDPSMRRARAVGTRLRSLLAHVVLDALLPLGVAFAVVSFLADPAHIDTSELRANSLLMNTSQLFRKESNPFAAAVGSSAILMLTSIAGALAIGVPAGIAYGWSANRALKALAWSVSTLAASLPAFFWAVAIELLMILLWVQWGLRFLPTAGFGLDEHLVLPSLALGIRPAAYILASCSSVRRICSITWYSESSCLESVL